MKVVSTVLLSLYLAATACHGCSRPTSFIETYQEKAGLPLPGSKNSDVNTYPNLPRYGTNCGHNLYWNDGESSLIVGGVQAFQNELPYQVYVDFKGDICGGTIIHP